MGGNWRKESPCKTKSLKFPFLMDITPTKKLTPAAPPLITDPILEKKVSVISFRQILLKILLAAYIFSNTIMINLKKLIRNISLNTKQCPAGLSPRIIPLNSYGKPWGWERMPGYSQKFTHSPQQKILHNKSTSFAIKIVTPSSSNNNFDLITLYKLYLQFQSLLLHHFNLTSGFMYTPYHANFD